MPHKNKNLEVFRDQIDSIDQQILDLLVERGYIVKQVTETKLCISSPVFVPIREQEKTAAFKEVSAGKRNRSCLGRRFFAFDYGVF